MRTRKPKGNEPSLRDKLSAAFLKAFESDFDANGVAVIRELRLKSPEKYAEIASRLIAAAEPKANEYAAAQTLNEVGFLLLKNAGVNEYDISEEMIEAALEAQDVYMAKLQEIKARAEGQIQ